jgi:hypothetical protein
MAMTLAWWTQKKLALILSLAALACAAAVLSSGLTHPEPTASASLGAEWQCVRIAGMLTSCTKARHTEPLLQSSQKKTQCQRQWQA